ncbi:hypothetical protein [Caenispirillum bisanense]|uniref:hypothetical protein n=1 Tax=Caenispirillum bisanense TaxID=414052 RepID=UPI0031DB02DA
MTKTMLPRGLAPDDLQELAREIEAAVMRHRPVNLTECRAGANTYAGEHLAHLPDDQRALAVAQAVESMAARLGRAERPCRRLLH